jgi:TRAP-type C4-dicarboxylate transport system permease small subunit
MKTLLRFNKRLQGILNGLNGAILFVTVWLIVLQTFCRFVLKDSPTWTDELTRYLFVVLVFVCVSVAIEQDALVRLELFDGMLPSVCLRLLNFFRYFLPVVISVILAYQSIALVQMGALRKTSSLPFTMAVPYGAVLVGFVLCAFSGLCRLIEFLTGGRD